MTIARTFRIAILLMAWIVAAWQSSASGQTRVVHVFGWNDYIDPDVLLDFTEETGIQITYDSYDSEAALERKLKTGSDAFDVVIISAPSLSKQIASGAFLKLDEDKLPNRKFLWPEIMELLSAYDVSNQFAVNYMWFTLGISFNVEKIKNNIRSETSALPLPSPPLDSWSVIFKPDYLRRLSNCGIGVIDNPEFLLAIARRYLWSDWKSASGLTHETDLKRAGDMLSSILRDVRKLDASNYVAALANGEICLAVGYSVDSFRARDEAREAKNGVEVAYALPREGAPVLMDNLTILKASAHVAEAYQFIDFLLRPEIAARNTNFTHVANGVLASKPLVDKKLSEDRSVYPGANFVERLFVPEKTYMSTQNAFLRQWTRMR